jgi:hypothetical protein
MLRFRCRQAKGEIMKDEKQAALEATMDAVMDQDNVGEAATVCWRYPHLPGHAFTRFEGKIRDWGLLYGIAFGLAKAEQGDEPDGVVAERAYKVARARFGRWAGEIEDPDQELERVLRDVTVAFGEAQHDAWSKGQYHGGKRTLPGDLCDALQELEIVMGDVMV